MTRRKRSLPHRLHCRTLKVVREGGGGSHIIVQGLQRFEVLEFTQTEPYLKAKVRLLEEPIETVKVQAMTRTLRSQNRLVSLLLKHPQVRPIY